MYVDIWTGGAASTMDKVDVNSDSYRLIPSHFPPISLFENLLDPEDLETAYELEGLTNDRLQDEAGNIFLVAGMLITDGESCDCIRLHEDSLFGDRP